MKNFSIGCLMVWPGLLAILGGVGLLADLQAIDFRTLNFTLGKACLSWLAGTALLACGGCLVIKGFKRVLRP